MQAATLLVGGPVIDYWLSNLNILKYEFSTVATVRHYDAMTTERLLLVF
jgi:hypothetical protein